MNDLFDLPTEDAGPIECLGQTFSSNKERREHFLKLLTEKLKDPEFRKIDGFPMGTDADILALSDPPYYTACPNPFIADFIQYYGNPYDSSVSYSKEPFAADVSEGKNDPIYNAHSYHTKSLSKNNLYNFISEGGWCSSIHHENLPSGFGPFRAPYRSPEFLLDKD